MHEHDAKVFVVEVSVKRVFYSLSLFLKDEIKQKYLNDVTQTKTKQKLFVHQFPLTVVPLNHEEPQFIEKSPFILHQKHTLSILFDSQQ